MNGNYYPVDVENPGKKPEPKNKKIKKLSQPQIKWIAVIILIVIALASGTFFIINKIRNPELLKVVLKPTLDYDGVYSCGEGMLRVYKDNKFGLIDKTGKTVAPLIYNYIEAFSEGLAVALKDGKWGYIDAKGEEAIPCIYAYARAFNNGFATISNDAEVKRRAGGGYFRTGGKTGIIDKTGNLVIPAIYDSLVVIDENLIIIYQDGKWGIIDRDGDTVLPLIYDGINYFNKDLYLYSVWKDGKTGVIDIRTGEEVNPSMYDEAIYDFTEEMSAVQQENGKWGYVNEKGETVAPFIYNEAYCFIDGYAVVSYYFENGSRNLYGMIDKTGREVIPCSYKELYPFKNGLAKAHDGKKYGMINEKGETVVPFNYNYINPYYDCGKDATLIKVVENQRLRGKHSGILDKNGAVAMPVIYNEIVFGKDGLITFLKDGLWGIWEINNYQPLGKYETVRTWKYNDKGENLLTVIKRDGKYDVMSVN